ncbi:MAG TPA: DUF2934 domain-containing protein [Verrucomicrobiae bacterium]
MSTERTHQNEVANRAYRLWESAGRPHGRDLEFWVQAEAETHGHVTSDTTGFPDTAAESPIQAPQSTPSVATHTRGFQHRTGSSAQSAARKGTGRAR